jgi:cell division protease FtsH
MKKKMMHTIMCLGMLLSIDHIVAAPKKNNKNSNQTPPPVQPPIKKIVKIDTELPLNIFYPGDIKTTFNDIAGLEIAKACLLDIISYLKDSSKYDAIGAKLPKGILFDGSTGNGKTMLARAFAGECNCPFISMNGSSFVEMYVGVGPSRIRELFSIARKLAPCVIFIDEIDALLAARGNDKEYSNTVNAFLTEIDGIFNDNATIVVIGATNRIDALDEAAIRPGRFDRKIYVSKPTVEARLQLLKNQFKKVKHAPDLDIDYIARMTTGFSCAELTNLVNEAAIIAVNANSAYVDMVHIKQAFDRMKNRKG